MYTIEIKKTEQQKTLTCRSRHLDHARDVAVSTPNTRLDRQEPLLGASGRPLHLTADTPTPCCGSRLLIECDGTYRCPCGKRQERLAKATICAHLMDTPNMKGERP